MSRLSVSRKISYDAMVEVLHGGKAPKDCLEGHINGYSFPVKRVDVNLAYEITFGSLRWWRKLFWILQNYASRDLEGCAKEVQVALVAGTYQIYYLDRVPDRACVNESVEYVRQRKHSQAVPFVNGILRQVAARAMYFPKPNPETDPVDFLSLQFAHPSWIVKRWHKRFGYKKLHGMLKHSNQAPPFTIRLNVAKVGRFTKVEELHKFFLKSEKMRLYKRPLKYCYQVAQRPLLTPQSLFGQGYFSVQDEASQLIALLVNPGPGETVVDACSGPGGKLTHLYELALNVQDSHNASQASVSTLIAFEKQELAYARLMENVERIGCVGVLCFRQDFLKWFPTKAVDKVLLDASCSGLGVLRRHPEGKLFKELELVGAMAKVQRELLVHAWEILAPGGEMVYSVCSFEPEEVQAHLQWIKATYGDACELICPKDRLQSYYRRFITTDKTLMIYSGSSERMDGFSAFIVKKNAQAS